MNFKNFKLVQKLKNISPKLKWTMFSGLQDFKIASRYIDYIIPENKSINADSEKLEKMVRDTLIKESYTWMRRHPIYSIFILAIVEATANLVIYGAVLREILEWNHRPAIIIPAFAVIMGLFSLWGGNPLLMVPAFLVALVEGYVYEYTRSIIPIIIGDVVFWIVMLCLVGIPTQGWWSLVAWVLVTPGIPLVLKSMEPYKPID